MRGRKVGKIVVSTKGKLSIAVSGIWSFGHCPPWDNLGAKGKGASRSFIPLNLLRKPGNYSLLGFFLFFGVWQFFFPEKVFQFREGRKFGYPPEPSTWALWNIRIGGIVSFLLALAVIWLCWVDPSLIERFLQATS